MQTINVPPGTLTSQPSSEFYPSIQPRHASITPINTQLTKQHSVSSLVLSPQDDMFLNYPTDKSNSSFATSTSTTLDRFVIQLKAAIADGQLMVLRKLFQSKKLSLNYPDPSNGWPPLFYAIRFKQLEVMQYLLAEGHETLAGLSKDFLGNSALMIACNYKNMAAFTLYAELYPDSIYMENLAGETPILQATKSGLRQLVVMLLDKGVDVNAMDRQGSTLLHHAAAYGYYDIVNILLERGGALNVKNKSGWTAVEYSYSIEMKEYISDLVLAMTEKRPVRLRREKTLKASGSPLGHSPNTLHFTRPV